MAISAMLGLSREDAEMSCLCFKIVNSDISSFQIPVELSPWWLSYPFCDMEWKRCYCACAQRSFKLCEFLVLYSREVYFLV